MENVILINVSGPYGVGKDSLLSAILSSLGDKAYRVSTLTTRPVSGHFDPSYTSVGNAEFQRITAAGSWLVNAQLEGQFQYATNIEEINSAAARGQLSVLSLFAGPDGAGALRSVFGSRLLSFGLLATGQDYERELEELERRLRSRGREDPQTLGARLLHQREKIDYIKANPVVSSPDGPLPAFDAVIVNALLPVAISEALTYMGARKLIPASSPMILRSDRDILDANAEAVYIGGSYYEPADEAAELGRSLLEGGELQAKVGSVEPNFSDLSNSYFLAKLHKALTCQLRSDELLFGLYEHSRGYKIAPCIYNVERLADFELQVPQARLQRLRYIAIDRGQTDSRLSL